MKNSYNCPISQW